MGFIGISAAIIGTASLATNIVMGTNAAHAQQRAQDQAQADQARQQKAAEARKPNTSAILATAQAKAGTSSGTNLTGGMAINNPLGGGASLLGG